VIPAAGRVSAGPRARDLIFSQPVQLVNQLVRLPINRGSLALALDPLARDGARR
jgi:hypothetical protein